MLDSRRRFNSRERAALYLLAGGKCSICGTGLEAGWHADHVMPWIRHGQTDVINGQALCPPCNLKKGSTTMELRNWQKKALEVLNQWRPTGNKGFLVEATPGAGKTRFAIAAAQRLFDAGRIDRVVIAVPTARLEHQWSEEFAKAGVAINPEWHASTGVLPRDEQGCAATYAEIARSPLIFRALVAQRRTLVILDEVHHCADELAWGESIREAFDPAASKLLLSGTPFRSDNNEIPFVNYVDGTGAPDYRYGYESALADGVVRAVFFPRRGGTAEWTYREKEYKHTFDEKLSEINANHRLRTAIHPGGEWLPAVLADADRQLMELREADPVAGGIVFCDGEDSARAVKQMLESMGREVTLAISKEPESQARIGSFGDSSTPWLVSIRQVSEGVDIPRLRVGVYATNYLTEMFFRQAVGRLVRVRPDEDDSTGYLFIPDDERLRMMAENIRAARDHVLNEQVEEQTGPLSESGEGGSSSSAFKPISSEAEDRGMIVNTGTITPEQLAEAERIKSLQPDTAGMPTALVAKLLQNSGHFDHRAEGSPERTGAPVSTVVEKKHQLARSNNSTVRRIGLETGVEYSRVNSMLNRAVGVATIKHCTEEQLRRRLMLAQQWLKSGNAPMGV